MDPPTRLSDQFFRVETVHDGAVTQILLCGEVDTANLPQLEDGLADIALGGNREVRFDVSDLNFMDVAALRQLTLFARHLRESGYDVRTRGAQPLLEHLVRLTGVEGDLGLT